MNPYRQRTVVLHARASRFLRTSSLARFSIVVLAAGAFASGFALGRRPAEPAPTVTSPPVEDDKPASPSADTCDMDSSSTESDVQAVYAITPEQAKATIAARAREALRFLGKRDLRGLASLVDADDGLRLGVIGGSTTAEISAAELARCLEDGAERAWSIDDVSGPAKCGDVLKEHVLDAGFAGASQVEYNRPSVGGRPASLTHDGDDDSNDPTLRAFRDAIVVQVVVRRPSLDRAPNTPCGAGAEECGWSTLRLVWKPRGEQWKLAAILWREWWT